MKYTIEYCPFDSAIFEMKWGRIQFHDYDLNERDFSEILFQIKDEEYEYIDAKFPVRHKRILTNLLANKFRLICTQVKLAVSKLKPGEHVAADQSPEITVGNLADFNAVLQMIENVFKFDRFNADELLPRKNVRQFYRQWALNNLDGRVDFYVSNGRSICFNRVREKTGIIDLIAVSPEEQSKGIGTQLVQRSKDEYILRGLQDATVVTELENIPSIRLYEKCGYRLCDSWHVLHLKCQ